jgi:hypothetical protein
MVDLKKGVSFSFLGFEYRRVLSLQKKWRPYYAPKLKKRTALYEKLREIFRTYVSWPFETVIALGGHPKPAICGRLKTCHHGKSQSDVDAEQKTPGVATRDPDAACHRASRKKRGTHEIVRDQVT